jgi:hypothetical protein
MSAEEPKLWRVTWELETPLPGGETCVDDFTRLEGAVEFLAFTATQWGGDLKWIKLEWLDE